MMNENRTGASLSGASEASALLTVGPVSGLTVSLCEKTLQLVIKTEDTQWETESSLRPAVVTEKEEIDFARWQKITHETVKTGYGRGIHSSYRSLDGREDSYAFDTLCWIEETGEEPEEGCAGKVHFEWIPICEQGLSGKEVR